jgi:predicted membrane-bound spermidine synthase
MLSGLVGGLVFPLANQIYLSENQEATNKTGVIYGADLIGAALGAIISPLILIPVYGVLTNLFLIAFLNIWLIFILRQKLEP